MAILDLLLFVRRCPQSWSRRRPASHPLPCSSEMTLEPRLPPPCQGEGEDAALSSDERLALP